MLKTNLQFFAEENGENENKNTENQNNENKSGNENNSSAETKNAENMIPYSRFKEVNDNYKAMKEQLDSLVAEKQQAETEAKKKSGEFEELYNNLTKEHEPLKEELGKYQKVFKTLLDTKLAQIPEEMKDLIPDTDDLAKLTWIENAISKGLFSNNKVKSFGNKGNNPPSQNTNVTKEQFMKMSYTERAKLATDDPKLYSELTK